MVGRWHDSHLVQPVLAKNGVMGSRDIHNVECHQMVKICLNRQLHHSQGFNGGPIEGVEGAFSIIDAIKNAHFFGDIFEDNFYS